MLRPATHRGAGRCSAPLQLVFVHIIDHTSPVVLKNRSTYFYNSAGILHTAFPCSFLSQHAHMNLKTVPAERYIQTPRNGYEVGFISPANVVFPHIFADHGRQKFVFSFSLCYNAL